MKHLELNEQLIFCEKYDITPNELLLFEIIIIYQENDDPDIVSYYFKSRAKGDVRNSLTKLQTSGLINASYKIPNKGEALRVADIPLNKTVVKDYYKASYDLGKELFEVYPIATIVNGIEYKLRRVSKKFNSLEDAYRAYGKAIRWKPEVHKRIIELVQKGKETNYSFTTLDDFIVDNDWVNLEAIADKPDCSNMRML